MDPFSFDSFGKRQAGQIAIDLTLAGGVWMLAHLLRYGGVPTSAAGDAMWTLLPAVVVGKPAINFLLGHYRQLWRYTSLREVLGVQVGAAVAAAGLWLAASLTALQVPLSVIVIDAGFYMLAAPGVRLLRRVQQRWVRDGGTVRNLFSPNGTRGATARVLLIGADEAADTLLRELTHSNSRSWRVVGLLDDDPGKHGSRLHGVPVLGATTEVERIVEDQQIDRVVVGLPGADEAIVRDLVRRVRATGVAVSRLPSPGELVGRDHEPTTVTLSDLTDVTEVRETLLGRVGGNGSSGKTRVLVTGGAGYIGSHLVRRFLREGHEVRVLDNLLYGDRGIRDVRDHPRFELVEGDVCNVRDVTTAVKDVDTVVALAAIVGDPACGIDAEATLNLNFESTKILAEACNFYSVDRIIFASTCSVYGAKDDGLLDETSTLNPVSLYARTKIMSENILLERLGRESSTTPVLLRLATIFGLSPRMRFDLVVNALTVRAVVDGKFQVFGGEQWRPFIHCADAAKAFYMAATAPEGKVAGEIFNVGSTDLNHQIKHVGELVADEIPGAEGEHLDKEVDARNYRVSFEKIAEVLGYEPEYDLREGIREMAAAVREERELQNYGNEVFSNVRSLESEFTPTAAAPS